MIRKIFETDKDTAALVLRVLLAIVFFPHGAQKVLGWFGGPGFSGTMDAFTVKMGIPAFLALLAILAESAGSIGLLTGFFTRIAAFGIFCNMVVAVATVHFKNGFFMNWFGNQKGEGFEYHLLVIAISIALIIKGGGRWSVDGLLAKVD
ncbi:MAG TPA: DoxX family protein [Thermodesulfovibrionales bacterium]|nr:DoxX family protein [Thermodesulfovibrionales bacterium]